MNDTIYYMLQILEDCKLNWTDVTFQDKTGMIELELLKIETRLHNLIPNCIKQTQIWLEF